MKFEVEVAIKVTLGVEAATKDEAIEKAGAIAWTYDPDEMSIKVVREEREWGPGVIRETSQEVTE